MSELFRMETWMPIATAPHNKTVLTRHAHDLYPVSAYRMETGWYRETEGPEDILVAGRHEPLYRQPTHWMRLPPLDPQPYRRCRPCP